MKERELPRMTDHQLHQEEKELAQLIWAFRTVLVLIIILIASQFLMKTYSHVPILLCGLLSQIALLLFLGRKKSQLILEIRQRKNDRIFVS